MKNITLLVSLALLLSACQAATTTPTPTSTPAPTATPNPTPTSTPIPPLVLSNFDAQMEGVGEHGNMTCITYSGNPSDLEGLTIKANISQGDKVLDTNVPVELIDGKNCFEMVDAKYVSVESNGLFVVNDIPISIEIKINNSDKQLLNNTQSSDLGIYKQYPFLSWIFSNYSLQNAGRFRSDHKAWDFIPSLKQDYSKKTDVPLLSPISGYVILINRDFPYNGQMIKGNNFYIYSDYTGLLFQLGHSSDIGVVDGKEVDLDKILHNFFTAGEQISYIGIKDIASSAAHIHFGIGIPEVKITPNMSEYEVINIINNMNGINCWIDYVNTHLFIDDSIIQIIKTAPPP